MSTLTINMSVIRTCKRCGLRYDFHRSPSSLKMTYCGSLCENADLGFTLDALMHMKRQEVIQGVN